MPLKDNWKITSIIINIDGVEIKITPDEMKIALQADNGVEPAAQAENTETDSGVCEYCGHGTSVTTYTAWRSNELGEMHKAGTYHGIIYPNYKVLEAPLAAGGINDVLRLKIKYCPFCGRKL